MTVTEPEDASVDSDAVRAEIARVRAAGVLGASGRLRELFDFLVERSDDDAPPKEVEIAVTVFGKPDAETLKDDPVARVYVHRLRKRLDEFYRDEGAPSGVRLDIPRGQYRIVGRAMSAAAAAEAPDRPAGAGAGRWRLAAAAALVAVLAAVNLAGWAMFAGSGDSEAAQMRRHPVWAELAGSERPLLIVAGDYYLFGDYGHGAILRRLVRDFSVNSREDLLALRMADPEAHDRYTDVNLQYIPISAAYALGELMHIAPDDKPVRVSLSSELTPGMMRDYDVIYVGLLSGMGMLRGPVFADSRFAVGDSFDVLTDIEAGETYVSEAFVPQTYEGMYRDYGLFSAFDGPAGNRIVVIAGARDAAVAGVAERVTALASLDAMREAAGGADSFEALFEIEGQQNISLDGRLLAAAPLDSARIWTAEAAPAEFPDF